MQFLPVLYKLWKTRKKQFIVCFPNSCETEKGSDREKFSQRIELLLKLSAAASGGFDCVSNAVLRSTRGIVLSMLNANQICCADSGGLLPPLSSNHRHVWSELLTLCCRNAQLHRPPLWTMIYFALLCSFSTNGQSSLIFLQPFIWVEIIQSYWDTWQWQIKDVPDGAGGVNPKCRGTIYYFNHFSRKLHEIETKLGQEWGPRP